VVRCLLSEIVDADGFAGSGASTGNKIWLRLLAQQRRVLIRDFPLTLLRSDLVVCVLLQGLP